MPAFSAAALAMFWARSISRLENGGWLMARRGVFVRAEEVALLEEAARWRRTCIDVLSRSKPQGPLYNATTAIVEAIDGLAEVVRRQEALPSGEPADPWAGSAAREVAHRRVGEAVFAWGRVLGTNNRVSAFLCVRVAPLEKGRGADWVLSPAKEEEKELAG
ncbi:hypothetical protein ABIE45_002640 [Methylobacterium sp. OAE515]|uniref:hypothetical protein n=1 Tax=Methylobacterium sp. OAE515 TaxID=2817895 RepID=UPI00178B918E